MGRISSGIYSLDNLIESLHIGDNVVWEVDAGTSYDVFVKNFIRQSFENEQKVIYVSFNRSPQSVLNEIGKSLNPEHFTLIDCFTSGKGKNDTAFLKFYDSPREINVVRIINPRSIEEFTERLSVIEDSLPPGARYVFDSLTGMQDLWGDENDTYRFFTHMCPRLFDLDTVAYWILEKDAHSQKFKANLRHITQVVFDVYKRRDNLFIKALKLAGRQDREAFKPHLYEISNGDVSITQPKKEPSTDIGSRVKDLRMRLGMSQKDLAEKVDLTPSFVSQLENNQISPSLNSFLQICNVLGVNPGDFLGDRKPDTDSWLFKRQAVLSGPASVEDGVRMHTVLTGEKLSVKLVVFPPDAALKTHFHYQKMPEFIFVVSGELSLEVEGSEHRLSSGDGMYLKKSFPSRWKSEGGDEAIVLVVW
jgi:KaiC/GvpD/RAD55 family RecA-like ATPase/quercetin dioxygenase-like cupin family protein